jgi:hypothetical protein
LSTSTAPSREPTRGACSPAANSARPSGWPTRTRACAAACPLWPLQVWKPSYPTTRTLKHAPKQTITESRARWFRRGKFLPRGRKSYAPPCLLFRGEASEPTPSGAENKLPNSGSSRRVSPAVSHGATNHPIRGNPQVPERDRTRREPACDAHALNI